jgi:hypothetical protein
VCCLRHRDQVDAAGAQRQGFRAETRITHARARARLGELPGTGIGGKDDVEVRREVDRRLAIAGREVQCQRPGGGKPREVGRELRRITRPVTRVLRGEAGKMILEGDARDYTAGPSPTGILGATRFTAEAGIR